MQKQDNPLRSGWIMAAAVFAAAALLSGLWNLAALVLPGTRETVYGVLETQKIAADAWPAWFRIYSGWTVFTVLSAYSVGIPLLLTILHREDRGLAILAGAVTVLRQGLRVLRIFLIGLFVFKFVRYSLRCIGINGGSFLFYGMALFEGLLFTLTMLGFRWMLRFLDDASGSACAVRCCIASGEPDPRGIPPGTVTGLHLLAAVQLLLAAICRWKLPMGILELCLAAVCLLLGQWLKRFRSTMEWNVFRKK